MKRPRGWERCSTNGTTIAIIRSPWTAIRGKSAYERMASISASFLGCYPASVSVDTCPQPQATWTVSTVSSDPGYVCMPAGLPWRVDAGYVCTCTQQAPNYGTDYTLAGQIPESSACCRHALANRGAAGGARRGLQNTLGHGASKCSIGLYKGMDADAHRRAPATTRHVYCWARVRHSSKCSGMVRSLQFASRALHPRGEDLEAAS